MRRKRLVFFLSAGFIAAAVACAAPSKPAATKAAKAGKKESTKDGARKIVTYSLFGGPHYKSNVAFIEQRPFGTTSVPVNPIHGSRFALPGPALKPEPGNASDAGIAFGCREKVLGAIPKLRELTACYRHNVDKSWQAQTYFSTGYAEGIQHWGGGLSVGYAY